MRHTLGRLREPFAITVLVIGVIKLGLFGAHVVNVARNGMPFGWDALVIAPYTMPTGMLIAILGAVVILVAIEPVSRHARAITVAAAVVISIATATMLALIGIVATSQQAAPFPISALAFNTVAEILLQFAVTVFIWRLALGSEPAAETDVTAFMLPGSADEPAAAPELPAEPAGVQPVWKVEDAVGAQWSRAGDAATGAEAVVTGKDASDRWEATGGGVAGVNWAAIEGRRLSPSEAALGDEAAMPIVPEGDEPLPA